MKKQIRTKRPFPVTELEPTKESLQNYLKVMESSMDGMALLDVEKRYVYLNKAHAAVYGYDDPKELIGKTWRFFYSDAEIRKFEQDVFPILLKKGQWRGEAVGKKRDGSTFDQEISLTPIDGGGHICVVRDISEPKKAQKLLKNIFEGMDEGLAVVDLEYRIIAANKSYCEQVGECPDVVTGRHCYEASHGMGSPCYEVGEDCPVKHTIETGEPYTAIHIHQSKDGNPVYAEIKSYPIKDDAGDLISVIELINDISEKKKLEDQLRHAQKMEAIGQLAGGIAHDFNNILTAIIGYGSLLQMKMKEDDPLRINVEQILASSERAANLTHSLLTFSRKQDIHLTAVNINEIIKRIDKLLMRIIGEDIELKTITADKDLTVMADSGQLEQVLMNLCANARDAMPAGGTLTIEAERVSLGEEYVRAYSYGKPGIYALISVTDTGIGMDRKTREHIFEPYFTTKESGRGTGLGLSIVYGIIKQHKGFINVYSELGEGTTFKMYLPSAESVSSEETRPSEIVPLTGGTETILLAEDDPDVRELTKNVLEEFGYTVVEAVDGEDAIESFLGNRDRIDLLILDVLMPKKNGKEVYEEIIKLRPDIRTIFASGYTKDLILKKGFLEEGLTFVRKPISPTELLKKVREVIERRS